MNVLISAKRTISRRTIKRFLDFFVQRILANHPLLNYVLTLFQNYSGINKRYPLYLLIVFLFAYLILVPYALLFTNILYFIVGLSFFCLQRVDASRAEQKKGIFFLTLYFLTLGIDKIVHKRWWFRLYLCSKFWSFYFVLMSLTHDQNPLIIFADSITLLYDKKTASLPFRDLKDEKLPSTSSTIDKKPISVPTESTKSAKNNEQTDQINSNTQSFFEKIKNDLRDVKFAKTKKFIENCMSFRSDKFSAKDKSIQTIPSDKNVDIKLDPSIVKPQQPVKTETTTIIDNQTDDKSSIKPVSKLVTNEQQQTDKLTSTDNKSIVQDKPSVEPSQSNQKIESKKDEDSNKKASSPLPTSNISNPFRFDSNSDVKSIRSDGKELKENKKSEPKFKRSLKDERENSINIMQMEDLKNAKHDDLVYIVNEMPKEELRYPKKGSTDKFNQDKVSLKMKKLDEKSLTNRIAERSIKDGSPKPGLESSSKTGKESSPKPGSKITSKIEKESSPKLSLKSPSKMEQENATKSGFESSSKLGKESATKLIKESSNKSEKQNLTKSEKTSPIKIEKESSTKSKNLVKSGFENSTKSVKEETLTKSNKEKRSDDDQKLSIYGHSSGEIKSDLSEHLSNTMSSPEVDEIKRPKVNSKIQNQIDERNQQEKQRMKEEHEESSKTFRVQKEKPVMNLREFERNPNEDDDEKGSLLSLPTEETSNEGTETNQSRSTIDENGTKKKSQEI